MERLGSGEGERPKISLAGELSPGGNRHVPDKPRRQKAWWPLPLSSPSNFSIKLRSRIIGKQHASFKASASVNMFLSLTSPCRRRHENDCEISVHDIGKATSVHRSAEERNVYSMRSQVRRGVLGIEKTPNAAAAVAALAGTTDTPGNARGATVYDALSCYCGRRLRVWKLETANVHEKTGPTTGPTRK
jgi:hypothetical protein